MCLVGHSIGEIAAAHVAGVFSLEDACTLVAARARLMQALPVGGAMIAIRSADVPLTGGVSIAAVNGPDNVVLSGVEAEVLAAVGDREHQRLRVSHAFHSPLMEPMLDDFREAISGITLSEPEIPLVKDVTSIDYWVNHVRDTVRFADDVAAADAGTFLEIGPDGTLSALVDGIPALRKDRDEPTAFLTALARLHVTGTQVDWAPLYAGARRVDLPTYAFQHEWLWPSGSARPADATGLGLDDAAHPLLGAAVALADTDGVVFTTRLSTSTHQWLADHTVGGQVIVPGAALLELAIAAADHVGCARVEELTLATPLVLPERGAVQVQLRVTADRTLTVHSRPAGAVDDPWRPHASGTLTETAGPAAEFDTAQWPPAGATALSTEDCYERLAEVGFGYGPTFQALRAAWRHGDHIYADVALADTVSATRFGLHPALLDSGLHATMIAGGDGEAGLPFSWRGVTLHAAGADTARVRLSRLDATTLAIAVVDTAGAPVASIEALTVRPVRTEPTPVDALFQLDWTPAELPAVAARVAVVGGDPLGIRETLTGFATYPDLAAVGDEPVLVACVAGGSDVVESTHRLTAHALSLVQEFLAERRFAEQKLVFVTSGAVSGVDVPAAAVWGLIRTAQTEHPGRFGLVELSDGWTPDLLARAVASDEPQLVVGAETTAARLTRTTGGPSTWDPGTVVVTGGTGGLGALVTRHLVEAHGVTDVLLLSRRGVLSRPNCPIWTSA